MPASLAEQLYHRWRRAQHDITEHPAWGNLESEQRLAWEAVAEEARANQQPPKDDRDKPLGRQLFFGNADHGEEYLIHLRWDLNVTIPSGDKERPHWVDFEIWDVRGTQQDGTRLYGDSFVSDPLAAESLCHGFVKWDGCTQIYFTGIGTNGPALHFDSNSDLSAFARTLNEVRRLALVEVMERNDAEDFG